MNYKADISILASDLSAGETMRATCPRCSGGNQTLSVTMDELGHLVWQCFRATCPEKGSTSKSGTITKSIQPEIKKPKRVFTGTTVPLNETLREKIQTLWQIADPPYWYWTSDSGGRVAMSVRSPKYTHRGWVLRDIHGRSATKALTYVDEGQESLSWYKKHQQKPTVLVEDIPSAVRASSYVNAVALLGTGVGLAKALEIAEYATRPIVVALDQDATVLSFRHLQRYALLWGETKILPLSKDLKDMTDKKLKEILT